MTCFNNSVLARTLIGYTHARVLFGRRGRGMGANVSGYFFNSLLLLLFYCRVYFVWYFIPRTFYVKCSDVKYGYTSRPLLGFWPGYGPDGWIDRIDRMDGWNGGIDRMKTYSGVGGGGGGAELLACPYPLVSGTPTTRPKTGYPV